MPFFGVFLWRKCCYAYRGPDFTTSFLSGLLQEFGFKMEIEVRRRVWFLDENPNTKGALYSWFHWSSVSTQYRLTQCLCYAIFDDFLQRKCCYVYGATRFSTSFLRWMLHGEWKAWLCLFFYKKNTIVGVQRVYKRKHEIVWYMMMMHGYAYFLQEEDYFIRGV